MRQWRATLAAPVPTDPGGCVKSSRGGPAGDGGRGSPAQVAVHGLHAVVLAARQRAQLVEWHSWGERRHSAWSRRAHPKPSIEGLVGRRAGSAGDTGVPGGSWQTPISPPLPGLPLRGPGLQGRRLFPGCRSRTGPSTQPGFRMPSPAHTRSPPLPVVGPCPSCHCARWGQTKYHLLSTQTSSRCPLLLRPSHLLSVRHERRDHR